MHFGLIFLNLLSMQRLRVLLSVQTKKCNSSSNPDAVRTLYCIGLLSVLMHGCFKDSPDCRHEHSNYVPSFAPTN